MRKTLTGLVSLAVLMGTATAAGAIGAEPSGPASAHREQGARGAHGAQTDVKDRLLAVPGIRLIAEEPHATHRSFVLSYTQPVDHRRPERGSFQQRFTLLHRGAERPTVFHNGGYELMHPARLAEPTQIVDGNQISVEHRHFGTSHPGPAGPQPADYAQLTIRQAADDQHRLFTALRQIYPKKWLATGNSKGGMATVYYERFHPGDMDGVIAYVAPNDVDDAEDSAYDRFFRTVGTEECRSRLHALEREALVRRDALSAMLADRAAAEHLTFRSFGSLDRAYEAAVREISWTYWQAPPAGGCAALPDAPALTDRQLHDAVETLAPLDSYADQRLDSTPYYYQAGTELGLPQRATPAHLAGLVRHPPLSARLFVPREVPMAFRPRAMADVDRWVRHNARQTLFVNGEYDPWAAEPFRLGRGAQDSHVLTAPGGGHYSHIADLGDADRALATAKVLQWAGVAPASVLKDPSTAQPLTKPQPKPLEKPLSEFGAGAERNDQRVLRRWSAGPR